MQERNGVKSKSNTNTHIRDAKRSPDASFDPTHFSICRISAFSTYGKLEKKNVSSEQRAYIHFISLSAIGR